jgi:homoserine kinase type II
MEGELEHVLRAFGLGELRAVCRIEQGFVNENWRVQADRGRYFLKRRHPDLSQPFLIRAQHELMRELRRAGFPAPVVVPTLTGESFLVLGGRIYEVHQFIQGQPYDHERPQHLEEAALTLGHYHRCVEGFAPQALCRPGDLYSPALLEGNLGHLIEVWGLERDPGPVQITEGLKVHTAELDARYARHGRVPQLVIHGDYYAGNLLFDGDRMVGVVDYDKARWQPRVVELAEALIYFASPRPGHLRYLVYPGCLRRELFTLFLQGYGRVITLGEEEVRALPDIIGCIWLQVSLQRLAEKGERPAQAQEALQEVLTLGDWAIANAEWLVEVARSATGG